MNQKAWRTGIILGLGLFGLACTGTDIDAPLEASDTTQAATPTTTEATTTTVEETTTTISEAAQQEQAARAEIEDVITKWITYPLDTSKGDEGIPLQYTTGLLQQRQRDNVKQRTDAGQIQREQGTSDVSVLSIELDLEAKTAKAEICNLGRGELIDAKTNEIIQADNDLPSLDEAVLQLTPDGWRVADYFYSGVNGNPITCDLAAG